MLFTISLILALATAGVLLLMPGYLKYLIAGTTGVLAAVLFAFASSVHIDPNEIGIVYKQRGKALEAGKIIALNGEAGYQAQTYGFGMHYLANIPLIRKVTPEKILIVPTGSVATLKAKDGATLPNGSTFAPEWTTQKMLDAEYFLKNNGYKGPQLTVLPPGNYPINTALWETAVVPATTVQAGQVAVIKDMGGILPEKELRNINGNPIVNEGERGIWSTAKTTGVYYYNPTARQTVYVATTEMSYAYQNGTDNTGKAYREAIVVRTKDGFQADIDVRVNVVVTPENAASLVATIGDPDRIEFSDQEQEKLSRLEAIIILPEVRSAVRNIAETIEALTLVNQRSNFEDKVAKELKRIFELKHLKFNSALIGAIDLTVTEAGKKLIETQTAQRVATEEQNTYASKKAAEEKRKELVRAQTEADQEADLARAEKSVEIATKNAEAAKAKAVGDANVLIELAKGQNESYKLQAQTLGSENVAKLEIVRLAGEKNVVITPQIVSGGNSTLLLSPTPAK